MNLIKIAKDTQNVIDLGYYTNHLNERVDITTEINESIIKSVYYKHDFIIPALDLIKSNPKVYVTNETTAQAARRYNQDLNKENIVALNFASAKNPGGGWLRGAKAQEEDLARCSSLYSSLLQYKDFYDFNRSLNTSLYSDAIIYSKDVVFFRDFNLQLTENPYFASIITSPAPNTNFLSNEEKKQVPAVVKERIRKILSIAAMNKHKTLILGAWGCGVFGNSSFLIASEFKNQINDFDFEEVCFAIYDTDSSQITFNIFNDILK